MENKFSAIMNETKKWLTVILRDLKLKKIQRSTHDECSSIKRNSVVSELIIYKINETEVLIDHMYLNIRKTY